MRKAAVLFPGIGYSLERPLLYYSGKMARAQGYDVIPVPYSGFPKKQAGSHDMLLKAFQIGRNEAEVLLKDAHLEACDDLIFFSKSIGTAVAAHFTEKYQLQAKQIYYTPLTQTFLANPKPGIAFCGTADPWVPDVDNVIYQCAQVNIESHRVEGADHSLETGDVMKDIEILNQLMQCIKEYLQK